METRKKIEIEHYGAQAKRDYDEFNFSDLSSYRLLYSLLAEYCQNNIVLDYGCGTGAHSVKVASMGVQKVLGIDLSDKVLEVARERARREWLDQKTEFLRMDAEKMEFPDDYFDVILDVGTFSSIDLRQAFPELARVLKPHGFLIGIETFGHNPLTNLKRKINKLTGKRTAWATEHIFKDKDLKEAKKYFEKIEVHYFHLISWLAFPFLRLPGGKTLLKLLEFIDELFLKLPFLKKYAFKVVFVFSKNAN